MSRNDLINRLLADGEVVGIYYGDIQAALLEVDYEAVGNEGRACSWKHPKNTKLLDLRDNQPKPMSTGYLAKVRKHLRTVRDNGGFDGQ